MEKMFRDLKANEIECRPQKITEKGCVLLLYKDARVDANILDETVGCTNWQRHHLRDNANCIVSIWDSEKSQWIEKEDTGKESYTEKEKGLASDSFKRACFQWGIGRELYTAPFIYIRASDFTIKEVKGKLTTYDKFIVETIEINNGIITSLVVKNENTKKQVYSYGTPKKEVEKMSEVITKAEVEILKTVFENKKIDWHTMIKSKDISELTKEEFGKMLRWLNDKE